MKTRIKPRPRILRRLNPYADNKTLCALVMNNLPIKDDPCQRVKITGNYVDVTKQVHQLLKEGKIKRQREFGFGHSRHAGHTYFIKTTPTNANQ